MISEPIITEKKCLGRNPHPVPPLKCLDCYPASFECPNCYTAPFEYRWILELCIRVWSIAQKWSYTTFNLCTFL